MTLPDTFTPLPSFAPTRPLRRMMGTEVGCAPYQVFVYPRGLGHSPVGMLDHDPGWTSCAWERRRSDKSICDIKLANLAGASEKCRGLFAQIANWQHEIVVVRENGNVWSGPIIGHGMQSGAGYIKAASDDIWLSMRQVREHIKITADLSDLYLALWHAAMDRENTARWTVASTPTGIQLPLEVKKRDRAMADAQIGTIASAGLDYYTIGQTTYIGPLNDVTLASPLLDAHVMIAPDYDADGTLQANVIGVLGSATGGNQAAPYGEAMARDFIGRDGLLERVISDSGVSTAVAADNEAALLIATYSETPSTVTTVQLRPDAPFPLPTLIPGRKINIRLKRLPQPISGTYRIDRVAGSVDASQNSGQEIVSLDLSLVSV